MAREDLIGHIACLNVQDTLSAIRARLNDGDHPFEILKDCQEGMRQVGERYEREEYFISGLIMAGEIFRQALELIHPTVGEPRLGNGSGCILIGTVQGDIHDLGKDMVGELLRCHGFEVHDLGVDVSAEAFVEAAERFRPDIIGMSILMTNALDFMRDAIQRLRNSSAPYITETPLIIGGSLADGDVCNYVKADHWVNDAMEGVRFCLELKARKGV